MSVCICNKDTLAVLDKFTSQIRLIFKIASLINANKLIKLFILKPIKTLGTARVFIKSETSAITAYFKTDKTHLIVFQSAGFNNIDAVKNVLHLLKRPTPIPVLPQALFVFG